MSKKAVTGAIVGVALTIAVLGLRTGEAMPEGAAGAMAQAGPAVSHHTDALADALAAMPCYDPRWARVTEEDLNRGGRHGYVLDEAIVMCDDYFGGMMPGSTHFTIGGALLTVMCAGADTARQTGYLTQVWVWRESVGRYQREWMHEVGPASLQVRAEP